LQFLLPPIHLPLRESCNFPNYNIEIVLPAAHRKSHFAIVAWLFLSLLFVIFLWHYRFSLFASLIKAEKKAWKNFIKAKTKFVIRPWLRNSKRIFAETSIVWRIYILYMNSINAQSIYTRGAPLTRKTLQNVACNGV